MKTVQEIKQEHGSRAAEIGLGYQDTLAEIRNRMELEDNPYNDRLRDEERLRILREEKAEQADEVYRKTREAYAAEVERYAGEVAGRRTHLKERLFRVEGSEALARAATASEDELGSMLDIAAQAGNEDLARAVFVAAENRGFGDLVGRYFDEVNHEGRALYGEWSELPSEEQLRLQRENIDRVIPRPDYDRLMPPARANV